MVDSAARAAARTFRGFRAYQWAGLALIAVFMVGVLVTACSGNDDSQPAAPIPTVEPTATAEPTATPAPGENGATVSIGDATVARS